MLSLSNYIPALKNNIVFCVCTMLVLFCYFADMRQEKTPWLLIQYHIYMYIPQYIVLFKNRLTKISILQLIGFL